MASENEYLTSNRRIRYPFADDSTISYESDDSSQEILGDKESLTVFGCFVDAMVQIKSARSSSTPRISGIRMNGHSLCFSLVDASGNNPATEIVVSRSLSTKFPVVSLENDWCWYTFVLSSDGIHEYESLTDVPDISSAVLSLSEHCIGRSAHGVSSIQIYDGTAPGDGYRYSLQEALLSEPDHVVEGDVKILPGYNMQFLNSDSKYSIFDTDPNSISINAISGAGLGKIICSGEEEIKVYKTPGLVGGDGHVRIFNDTCYDLVPDVMSDDEARIQLHVKCKACCTCEMYADIVNNRLVPLKDEILDDREELNSVYETYEENVKKWNDRLATVLPEDIVISTTGVALDAAATDIKGGDVSGKMNRCGYSLMVRNDSFTTITIKFSDFSANGDPFESQISYMDANNNPVVHPVDFEKKDEYGIIASVSLPPGRSMTLTYFIRLRGMVTTDKQSGFTSRIRVSAYQGDRKIVSSIKGLGI